MEGGVPRCFYRGTEDRLRPVLPAYRKSAEGTERKRRATHQGFLSSECRKTVKTPTTGRKRVTRGTQEGFLSFSIRSFQNFFKVLKTCSGWRKDIFDSLKPTGDRRFFPAKKRSRTANAMRPKRVGYWKASYIKVPCFPGFVNRRFCRFPSSFVESGRRGRTGENICESFEKTPVSSSHFNTNMLYYTKGLPQRSYRPFFTRKERSR